MRISVVVPMHNEHAAIEPLFVALESVFAQLPEYELELVCVDDGSTDGTLAELQSRSRTNRSIVVVELARNFGKEAALSAGLAVAAGDAVIPMDSDLQDPPEAIPAMIEAWRNGADVVLARRVDRSSDSMPKRVAASLFYRVMDRLSEVPIPNNVGDFRLMDRKVVDALLELPEQQRMMKGLFAWVGFRTVTVDYVRGERVAGQTKFTVLDLVRLAVSGIASYSIAPLRIAIYSGSVIATLSLAYGVFITVRTLVTGVDVPGYASLLVATLFMGSLQILFIGIVGEYVGRIFHESKRRPSYIIRSIERGNDEG